MLPSQATDRNFLSFMLLLFGGGGGNLWKSRIRRLHTFFMSFDTFYRPRMKLWEGNVFSFVCLSIEAPHIAITHDALDLTILGSLGPGPLVVTSKNQDWRLIKTC